MFGIDDLGLILGAAKMVPKAWGAIAGLFGKKAPETVTQAGELIDGIQGELRAGKIPAEQQVELKRLLLENEQVKMRYDYEREKLVYDDQAGGRDVIKIESSSVDPLVRQARPKMMMRAGNAGIAYTFVMPCIVALCAIANVKEATLVVIIELMIWLGGLIWGAFMTSFTGYTVARSADKRMLGNSELSEVGTGPAGLLGMLSKLGHKIS